MGRLDKDLREVLRIKAKSDDIYMEGTEEATRARQEAESACFGFIHEHGLEVMGLYHLHAMAKMDIEADEYMHQVLGPDWKARAGEAAEPQAEADGDSAD